MIWRLRIFGRLSEFVGPRERLTRLLVYYGGYFAFRGATARIKADCATSHWEPLELFYRSLLKLERET